MFLDRIAEEKILEAMANGEFDNLPGQGQPIDHSRYFAMPEDRRVTYTVLKNAGIAPEEVQLLKDAAYLS
jgi:hypothetical protein